MTIGDMIVRIGADVSGMMSGFSKAENSMTRFGEQLQGVGTAMSVGLTLPIVAFGAKAVQMWGEAEGALKAVQSRVEQTGAAAGFSTAQLAGMAEAFEGTTVFDGDDILADVTQQFLTFGNIQGDVFARGQQAALDLSTVLGSDLRGQAIQLGKALEDPTKGITALARSGVTFTAAQKAMIASMVAAGDVAGAQGIILKEIEAKYGGAAAAAAAAGTGPFKQFAVSVGNLTEEFGGLIARALTPVVSVLNTVVQAVMELSTPWKALILIVAGLTAVIGPMVFAFGTALVVLPKIKAAMALLNREMLIMTLKVVAVTAVVAAFAAAAYLIYKNWDGVAAFFAQLWKNVVDVTASAFDLVGAKIEVAFLGILRTMSGLASKLLTPSKALADALGSDALLEQITVAQNAIANLVPESSIREAEGRARGLSTRLDGALSRTGATLAQAGGQISASVRGLVAEAQGAMSGLQNAVGGGAEGVADATAAAADGATAAVSHTTSALQQIRETLDSANLSISRMAESGQMKPLDAGTARIEALRSAMESASSVAGGAGAAAFRAYAEQVTSAERALRALNSADPVAPIAPHLPQREAVVEVTVPRPPRGTVQTMKYDTPKDEAYSRAQARQRQALADLEKLLAESAVARVEFEAVTRSVEGVAQSVGDALGAAFSSLLDGRSVVASLGEAFDALRGGVARVMASVVADIGRAIARALILKALTAAFGGGGGGGLLGGALASLTGGAGKTAPPLAIAVSVQGGEMRMSNGYMLAGLRAELQMEQRSGRGDGTLAGGFA